MRITVQLAEDAVGDVAQPRGERPQATPESRALWAMADRLGISLEPMHPGSDDPTLRTYFTADVPDGPAAHQVVEQLRSHPAVTAAYVKPPDALP